MPGAGFQVQGPYLNQAHDCPAGMFCRVDDIQGLGLRAGDTMMLRATCSETPSPANRAFSAASAASTPADAGRAYEFSTNSAVCLSGHESGPCEVARMCFCGFSQPPIYFGCDREEYFLVDAGTVYFYGVPVAVAGTVVIQEDYRSFTVLWDYPSFDGGGPVTHYTVSFRTCPGLPFPSGEETTVIGGSHLSSTVLV